MIIGVTGSTGSGKTSFAMHYAATFGREGFYMTTRRTPLPDELPAPPHFTWQTIDTECALPEVLHRINKQSNMYRADRRVLVIDSVTSYLHGAHEQIVEEMDNKQDLAEYAARLTAARMELQEALFIFQGKLFIITNEPPGYTPFTNPLEVEYIVQHAALNRELVKRSTQWFRMTSGIPEDISAKRKRK